MAKDTTKRLIRWPIDRLGIVLDTRGAPDTALKALLVHFKKGGADWHAYRADASGSFLRYANGLLFLGGIAYERIRARQDLSGAPTHSHGPEVLLSGAMTEEYGHVARYFQDIRKQEKPDGTSRRYHAIPAQLRNGIRNIFHPIARTAKLEHSRIELSETAGLDTIAFWRLHDFPEAFLDEGYPEEKSFPAEDLPSEMVPVEEVKDLLAAICASTYWRHWAKDATARGQKARASPVLDRLRKHLREQAENHLRYLLDSESLDSWVELGVLRGSSSNAGEAHPEGSHGQTFVGPKATDGRVWRAFPLEDLWLQRGKHFLSAVSGAGKTTFLRHVQIQCLDKGEFLPVFLSAIEISRIRELTWVDVRRRLMHVFSPVASKTALCDMLNKLHQTGDILLLIDAMDHLDTAGRGCGTLASAVIDAAGSCPVLMAGRPTAADQVTYGKRLTPLRLQSFSVDAMGDYFGESWYQRARNLTGMDQDLLRVPLLAYMIRTLIEKGDDRGVECRWDLYDRFLTHILDKHPSNRRQLRHVQWAHDVRNALGRIAYAAIDQSPPIWSIIPSDFVIRHLITHFRGAKADGDEIDELPACGLVELLPERPHASPGLGFVHQSFQEYLAAVWANQNKDRIDHILDEYWNPKWHEVLRFLVGKQGSDLIHRIFPSPQEDNAIHSRLFLASDLAHETSLTAALENRLLESLGGLSSGPPFRTRAIESLIHINTTRSLQSAWHEITDMEWIHPPSIPALEHIRQSKYVDIMVSDLLTTRRPIPEAYYGAMWTWADQIPENKIGPLFERHFANTYPSASLLRPLAHRVSDRWLASLVQHVVSGGPKSFAAHLVLLGRTSLPSSYSSRLVTAVTTPGTRNPIHVMRVLNAVEDSLTDHHIARILAGFWEIMAEGGTLLADSVAQLCRRFSPDVIPDFIKRLSDQNHQIAAAAAITLRCFTDQLTAEQVAEILPFAGKGHIRPEAIETIAATVGPEDAQIAHRLLLHVSDEDRAVRESIVESMPHLTDHLTDAHLDIAVAKLRKANGTAMRESAELPDYHLLDALNIDWTVIAIAANAQRLDDTTVALFTDSLDWLAGYLVDSRTNQPFDSVQKFQGRLDTSQAGEVVRQLCGKAQTFTDVTGMAAMLPLEELTKPQIDQLITLLDARDPYRREDIVSLLERVHHCQGTVSG